MSRQNLTAFFFCLIPACLPGCPQKCHHPLILSNKKMKKII